ncbi:MAG: sigma-70 family RNA polymerase sigma factor [Muribaculaceae bacterium]|nr:sigma-70 family RNA polymerase sigma factor [Muribaculaceae bacterium]
MNTSTTPTYSQIVNTWYEPLREEFINRILSKYKDAFLTRADAEDIYQDTFVAIRTNMAAGRVKPDTCWRNYILSIGSNMAGKHYRRLQQLIPADISDPADPLDGPCAAVREFNRIAIEEYAAAELDLFTNRQTLLLLNAELRRTPAPAASILLMSYCDDMSDKEIAAEHPDYCANGKSLKENADAIKARRWLVIRDLGYRLKLSLHQADLIETRPERKPRKRKSVA